MRRDRSVPYARIEKAMVRAEELWPGADKYQPVLHMGKILVEVWNGGHAKVYEVDEAEMIKPTPRKKKVKKP